MPTLDGSAAAERKLRASGNTKKELMCWMADDTEEAGKRE